MTDSDYQAIFEQLRVAYNATLDLRTEYARACKFVGAPIDGNRREMKALDEANAAIIALQKYKPKEPS